MNITKNCSEVCRAKLRSTRLLSLKGLFTAFISLLLMQLFYSCARSKEELDFQEKSAEVAHTIASHESEIATDTIDGITHNFIRSGQLKFKVKNVHETGSRIERLVAQKGGFVALNDLSSQITSSDQVKFKEDSAMLLTKYSTTGSMTLRIPNKQLDTAMNEIAAMADFIDYRRLKADDAKMSLYANILAEKRYQQFNQQLEKDIATTKKNLGHSQEARQQLLEKQALADKANIDSYVTKDQVNYGTLVLEFYQAEQVHKEVVAIPPQVEPYEPSFGAELSEAFARGLLVFKTLLIFIARAWSLVLITLVIFLISPRGRRFLRRAWSPSK